MFHMTGPQAHRGGDPAAAQFRSGSEACSAGAVAGVGGTGGAVL